MDSLTDALEASYQDAEKRSEPRQLLYHSIQFVIESGERNFSKGTVVTISKSGLGIYSFASLVAGDEITVKSSFPARYRRYDVRWITKLLDDFYMAGLRCKEHV